MKSLSCALATLFMTFPLSIAAVSPPLPPTGFAWLEQFVGTRVDRSSSYIWNYHIEGHGLEVRVGDHGEVLSLYFVDPDGNSHEITTWGAATARGA